MAKTSFWTDLRNAAVSRILGKQNPVWPVIVSLTGGTPFLWSTKDYAALSKAGYQSVAAVFGCVERIAKSAGAIDWYILDGENEIKKHPLLDLLRRPNEYAARSRFIQEVVSYLLLSGNSYILKVGGSQGQAPRFLYTLRPDRMTIKPDARNLVGAYVYTVSGQEKKFRPDEVLHLTEFHPTDDYYGLSRLEVAAKSVDIANLSMEWNANILNRDMRIPGALKVDGQLTSDQRKTLQDDLAKYQGAENAGKIPIFEGGTGGMEWQAMAVTAKDMDWSTSEKFNLRRICAIFNYPSMLMGDTEATTYSNMQEARASFYMEAVLPMMNLIKDEFNNWLVDDFGGRASLEYDIDGIEALQEDRGQQYAYIAQADWLTQNEKREATGWDDIGPEGDVMLVPMGKLPLAQAIAEPEPMPDFTPGDDENTPDDEPEPDDVGKPNKSVKSVVAIVKSSFWREPERKATLWKAFDRRLAMQERQFSPLVKKYLLQQAERVKARLKDGVAAHALLDVQAEAEAYEKRFFVFYERAFKYAGQSGLDATQGKLWEPTEEAKAGETEGGFTVTAAMIAKLKAQILRAAQFFNKTTWQVVQDILAEGMLENLTTEAVAQKIWADLKTRAAWECRRIAATELTRTDGWGAIEGYKQNDAIEGKGWNCQLLDNSRDSHIKMDGIEVAKDADFIVNDVYPMNAPGDERAPAGEVCNCRCSTYPVVDL